jgi:hypothetical protein
MRESIRISLDAVIRSETGNCLNMTVSKGSGMEQLAVAVSEETAMALETILKEEPFSPTKPGTYRCEVQEIIGGPGLSKTVMLQIYKGRAQTKRNAVVEKDLLLIIWNIFHFQELPSKLPAQKRTR